MRWDENTILTDENILFTGRHPQGRKDLLCWSGSSVSIYAGLSEWLVEVEADWKNNTPYLGVLVDGAPVARFALMRGRHRYAALTGMDPAFPHEYTLMRDTQPMSGEPELLVRVTGMETDGALRPVPRKPVLEFIGDSLTTGEGTVGPKPAMEWKSVWLSAMHSWGQTVCRQLHARGEWVSQSGWGLYTSWDNQPDAALGHIYPSCAAHSPFAGEEHRFALYPAAAVVINLGTNDWTAAQALADGDRPARLGSIYEAALKLMRQIHHDRPGAPILMTYGMCGGELTDILRAAAEEHAREYPAAQTAFLSLPPCPDEDLGSRWHPGPVHQERCGLLVAEKLREMGVPEGPESPADNS